MEIEENGCNVSLEGENMKLVLTSEENTRESIEATEEIVGESTTEIAISNMEIDEQESENSQTKNDIEDDIRMICGSEEINQQSQVKEDTIDNNILETLQEHSDNVNDVEDVAEKIEQPTKLKRSHSQNSHNQSNDDDLDLFGFYQGKFVFGKKYKSNEIDNEIIGSKFKLIKRNSSLENKDAIEKNRQENGKIEKSPDKDKNSENITTDLNTSMKNNENDETKTSPSVRLFSPPSLHQSTPIASTTATSKLRPSEDPIYRKPFEMGWKREIVLRALPGSKDKGEVYYITPGGKKLRTRHEIQVNLTPGLTLENFTFSKDPLGADPEDEIIRSAKPTGRISDLSAPRTPEIPTITPGKRVPKPKGPKGASPPPQGWTSTQAVKTQGSRSHSRYSTNNEDLNPKTVRGGVGGSSNVSGGDSSSSNVKSSNSSKKGEPCTIQCVPAMGLIPQLQCLKCLCLFHHECVGLDRNIDDFQSGNANDSNVKGRKIYECDSCKAQILTKTDSKPLNNPENPNDKSQKSNKQSNLGKSLQNPSNEKHCSIQSIAVLNGRKYLVIHKPGVSSSNEHVEVPSVAGNKASSVKIQYVDSYVHNLFGNVSAAYDIILNVFKYLKVQELLRAACVSRLWNHLANERSLWKIVRMKNSQVNDWAGFAATLSRNSTQHLDLRKMICPKSGVDRMWTNFNENIQKVFTLKSIDLGRCPASVVQNLFLATPQLGILNATSIKSETINLENLNKLSNLTELRLKSEKCCDLIGDLSSFAFLKNLQHLSLTLIDDLGTKNIEILGQLTELESLEIGECSTILQSFATEVLTNLKKLQRLRLEKSTQTTVTFSILEQIAEMVNLQQLELVNFDIRDGFEQKILACKNLKRFLLIPTYVSQSATTNQIILSSMRKLKTLESFTWVVTLELLSVTALYVDQCGSRDRRNFNDCIPVLKPVPGASPKDKEDVSNKTINADIQQIEILPLSTIKEILDDGTPNTRHKIVRAAHATTWRQTFVE